MDYFTVICDSCKKKVMAAKQVTLKSKKQIICFDCLDNKINGEKDENKNKKQKESYC